VISGLIFVSTFSNLVNTLSWLALPIVVLL
jgi:hypothetical protein